MIRSLSTLFVLSCVTATLDAQEIPGVRAMLVAPSIVKASGEVQMRLTVLVDRDASLPATLLNGYDLTVRLEGKDQPPVHRDGVGEAVQLLAGTRIDRMLTMPIATLLPQLPTGDSVALVAVSWTGMAGVDCSFQLAPDTSGLKVEDLDLAATEVVLVTNYGDMRVAFRPDKAPRTAANFVKLCLAGFYDNTQFHRVERDFVIQGGCPYTKDPDKRELWGTGGPGYAIPLEPSDLRHHRGTLSMAHSLDPNSGGSQFFIVTSEIDSSHLDRLYSSFGNVVEGIDTLSRIANVPTGGPRNSVPLQPVVLLATVVLPKKKAK